jgi:hypothetical protein
MSVSSIATEAPAEFATRVNNALVAYNSDPASEGARDITAIAEIFNYIKNEQAIQSMLKDIKETYPAATSIEFNFDWSEDGNYSASLRSITTATGTHDEDDEEESFEEVADTFLNHVYNIDGDILDNARGIFDL